MPSSSRTQMAKNQQHLEHEEDDGALSALALSPSYVKHLENFSVFQKIDFFLFS